MKQKREHTKTELLKEKFHVHERRGRGGLREASNKKREQRGCKQGLAAAAAAAAAVGSGEKGWSALRVAGISRSH
jgi:hypothetical protein